MKKIITIIFLFAVTIIHAQSRGYLTKITAPISTTLNAGWTKVANNAYFMSYPSKQRYAIVQAGVNQTSEVSGTTSPQKMICATFITIPLVPQTINSGATFSFQIRALKNASPGTGLLLIYVRYCNEDGTGVTDIGNATNATALTTTNTNRTVTITLGSNVTLTAGQRLIFEIGETWTSGSSSHACSISITFQPATTSADLPVDNTTTTANNCWWECSQTLIFRQTGIIAMTKKIY